MNVRRWTASPSSTYQVYVDNYSDEAGFTGNETVAVYSGDRLLQRIDLNSDEYNRAVYVMQITSEATDIINQPSA